jgi:hypothetical protein
MYGCTGSKEPVPYRTSVYASMYVPYTHRTCFRTSTRKTKSTNAPSIRCCSPRAIRRVIRQLFSPMHTEFPMLKYKEYQMERNHMLKLLLVPFSIITLICLLTAPVRTLNGVAQASEKQVQTTLFSPRPNMPSLITKVKQCKTKDCPKSNCDYDCRDDQECRTSCDPNTGDGICDCRNR